MPESILRRWYNIDDAAKRNELRQFPSVGRFIMAYHNKNGVKAIWHNLDDLLYL